MSNKEGVEKNLDRVKEGLDNFKEEAEMQTVLIKQALKSRNYIRALHHFTGYRSAAQEHMWKLWFYTFWPKWAIVAYLIWKF